MQHESSEPVDVLLVLGAYQLRGSYARAMSLVERLPNARVRLRLVSSDTVRLPAPVRGKLEVRESPYLAWPAAHRVARRFLAADFQSNPPHLVDIQHRGLHGLGAWLARKLKRPYVVTIHDYLRDRERFAVDMNWCRRVIAVSESVRSELLDRTRLPEEMVSVIPSGVMPPLQGDLTHILAPGRCPVIGTAGPLEAAKGLQYFLRAAAQVLKSHPDAMFLIAGSGPEERSLRRLATELQVSHALTILPNLNDFGPALKAMDIFVLPALKQGLGSTMLDAMARGLPVIGTESGGVFSVVEDGVSGILVPPSDEEALAEEVRLLLEDPERARRLGAAARQHVLERFHVDRMVESVLETYATCRNSGKG